MASDDAELIQIMRDERKAQGQYGVVKGMEGDKKKAADSISIESSTGRDSQRTYGNYDVESKKVKSELAQSIVEKDARLLRYIEGDPLAATVSQDDWGNLATFTDAAMKITGRANPIISAFKGMRNLHDAIYPGDASYFMRGFVTGITKENPELAAEFVEGMGYHMPQAFRPAMFTGSKAIRDYAATIKQEGYETKTGNILDSKSWSDVAPALAEKFGGAIASMVPGVVAGAAGAGAGALTPIPGGAIAGGFAGAASVSYAMGYGEVFKALKDEGVDPAYAANVSSIAAIAIGALDFASLKSIAGKVIAPTATKELSQYVAKRIAVEFAKGATKEGLTESMQEIVKDVAVSWAAGKEFGTPEQIKGWAEAGIVGALAGGPIQGAGGLRGPLNKDLHDVKRGADQVARTIDNAEPWIMNGETPPVGVDPVVDHFIGVESEEQIKILDAVIQNRDKSETRELSPEKWNDLTKIVFDKKEIEVRWDAVKGIYGDKIPEPGDKLLGDLPDIAQKFANSAITGESVKVKLSDWVGLIDSEVHKILHDDLTLPDLKTINEVKASPTLDEVTKFSTIPETEVPGLPQELDKPYSLKKGEEGVYDVLDEHGSLATRVRVVENEGGKNLHVHFRTGQIDIAGLRTLMKQLKEEYPDAETITSPKMPGVEALKRALQGSSISIGMPFRIKESTVDLVRKSGGLEPLFDLPRDGPRTVNLTRNKGQGLYPGDASFTITDELGREVGVIEGASRQKGKDFYVDWIGMPVGSEEGERGLVNKLGPKLVRNLFRQFREMLPGLKTITGFRATGSREKYGKGEVVQIDITRLMEEQENAPAGWDRVEGGGPGFIMPETQKLVDMIEYTQFSNKLWAKRTREWTPEELALEKKITGLLNKIVPQEVRHYGAEDIRVGSGMRRVSGVMQAFHDRRPLILWALPDKEGLGTSPHPEGTARHEAVHFLRQYGYIREDEWEYLTEHVYDNDLIKKHGIDTRYWYADEDLRIEEAIAEEYRTWLGRGADPEHWGGKVFQRIKEILDNIRSAYREYLGREPTVDDIFRDIDIGRTGRRTPTKGPSENQFGNVLHRTVDIQPEPRAEELPLDDNAFRDAGFTESEIRDGLTDEQKAKVRDGYIYVAGSLQPATPEMLAQFKEQAAKDLEKKAEVIKKLNHAFAQKPGYPSIGHIMPGDWGAGRRGNSPAEFRKAAYDDTEQRYSYNQRMVNKIERQLARRPAAYDPGGPVEGDVPMIPGLMDKARYAKYMKLINDRNNEDAEKELETAKREIKRKQTPEWKANEAEMKTEVTKEIANRPDWKVSQFFRNGMFFGMDTKYRPKIDPKFLTPEQIAGLPDQFVSKGGMDPDALAGSFGYTTGKALVDRMVEFQRVKGKLGPKEFFDEMVKQETNRRMELKYGNLQENILKEAMDHVVGTTQMDLLHEETLALATRAGQAFPLTKEDLRANQATRFAGEVASEVSMRGYFREMYRAGKAAELAFLKQDWAEAFKQKQQQVHLFALAEHAKKFEKVTKQLDRITKQFNKRDIDVKYIPPEYTEWIHSILFQIGRPPKRLQPELEGMIQLRDSKTLADFVEAKNTFPEGSAEYEVEVNPNLVVWDQLLDPAWKKNFDSLKVAEVRAINDTLQSLKKIGRDEQKYIKEGETRDLKELVGEMVQQISTLDEAKRAEEGTLRRLARATHIGLLQPEAWFDRLDRGNQRGLFSRMFGFPLNKAAGDYSALQQKYAKKITDIHKQYGLSWMQLRRKVDNDVFYEPDRLIQNEEGEWVVPPDGKNWMVLTKNHVRGVLLNWGNPSNRQRIAEGYHVTEEQIQGWLDKNADQRDYQWAREIGKIYEQIQKESDEMTFRMSGTMIEKLPLPSFMTPYGEFEGWYYPIIYDRTRDGGSKVTEEKSPPVVSRTYNGWERKRTGSAGPLDLSINLMGTFISKRLKDNAFREPLREFYKVITNKEFRKAVNTHQGEQYTKMLDVLYKDLAGDTGITASNIQSAQRFGEMILQNTIGALIAWNPGTVMKHGPSAFVQSWKEAGILKPDFYKAFGQLNSPYRWQHLNFMMKGAQIGDLDWQGSTELQNRHKHWAETIGGAGDIQLKKMNIREQFLYYGSYPVAWSDMYSSSILWKARYDKTMVQIGATMPYEEAHLQAVEMADKAVRRTHGSTSITSRPQFMRAQNIFARNLTTLYGFFNHMYNRNYRIAWMSRDLAQQTKRGEKDFKEFMKGATDISSDFMMYVAAPAMIEAIAVEMAMSADWDDMGWGELLAHGMLHTIGGSVPLVRDIVHAASTGRDPAAGLLTASFKGVTDFGRQLGKEEFDVGKGLQTGISLLGIATGIGSTQIGRWARFTYNYAKGEEDPTNLEEWYRAFRTGTTQMQRRH